jgi:hypothetical protein
MKTKGLDSELELSAFARKYVADERQRTMACDVAKRCSSEELRKLLIRHGLPVSAQILEFEQHLGGWCSSHPLSTKGLGIYLSLAEDESCSRVATELRGSGWIFEGSRDEPDDDGETSPIWGTGFPRAFFLSRPLVPIGMLGSDVFFFLGEQGEVYLWSMPLDEIYALAGSWRSLVEVFGLRHHKEQGWFEAHVCADVGELVSRELGVHRFEPACDFLFEWWANDDVQVRLVPDFAPCITGTHVACKNEADFVKVMSRIRSQLEVDRIRIWKRANGIVDQRGLDSLQRSGIDKEILTGPGPGHGGSTYDVPLCEPKNWKCTVGWRSCGEVNLSERPQEPRAVRRPQICTRRYRFIRSYPPTRHPSSTKAE